eukprot:4970983-Prymnesium_polylepis.1
MCIRDRWRRPPPSSQPPSPPELLLPAVLPIRPRERAAPAPPQWWKEKARVLLSKCARLVVVARGTSAEAEILGTAEAVMGRPRAEFEAAGLQLVVLLDPPRTLVTARPPPMTHSAPSSPPARLP